MPAKNLKWTYLVVLALVWGSSFILIKKGLAGLGPVQLGALRIALAAVFLLAVGFRSLPSIPRHRWKFIALTSLFGTFIPAFLFSIAQTEMSSTVSSILNSLTPVNTLLLGIVVFKLGVKRQQLFGVMTGLAGSALLILSGALSHPEQNYWYAVLLLIASLCYAANVNLIKKHLSDISPLAIVTGNFAVMLVPAMLILWLSGYFGVIGQDHAQTATIYVLVLAVVGTGIANIFFFRLIHMSSPVFATSVTYLIPVVAFFWGMFDGEMLTTVQFVGAIIIMLGVYLAGKKN